MKVNVALFKLKNTIKDNIARRNNVPYERPQRKLTLKEMQARDCPFLDSHVPGIFDDLLEANLIDLPAMNRPKEAEQKNDRKYCKYHRLVGHTIQDCFVFKDKVMQLARQGKISREEDSTATNAITIESRHVDGNKDSCNAMHGDNITSNEDTLFEKKGSSDDDDCMSTITFTNEDLLLGSKPHNHPLFVAGYVREQKVNRILIDGGSTVNILPLQILKELGILIDELSNSRLMIQGFNRGGQSVVGIIRIQLTMEDIVSSALFHIIDAKTSYNIIVKKVLGDRKPFTEAESHFVDAKYYIEDAKKGKKVLPPEEPKPCNNQNTRKNDSSTLEVELSKGRTLPLTQINMKQPYKSPLKLLIKVGYDPKEKLSLGKLPPEATGKKLHGLNTTQIMLTEKGHAMQDSRGPKEKNCTNSHRQSVFDRVLKAKAQIVIFTQVQSDDEDDKESVASSNYISNGAEEDIA
ncbi:hypothetical protein Sango_2309100 [Sesamum angolense]|uniref:Retrotransposon gag protein n=1 Tax=Sesamum angolense TaxID=2727404 RepID=A0AAE2BLF4_9LAMI|nr:hypothetical protein Sango_2309100 [Sesamum angolense]